MDIKSFKPSNLSFNKTNISNGKHVEILYNLSEFKIQLPKCVVLSMTPEQNKCDLVLSFDIDDNYEHYKFLQIFDYRIMEYLGDETVYKPGHNETTIVEQGYKKNKIIIKLKTTRETKFYDKQKKKMSHYEINVGDYVIPLVITKGIFMDEKESNQRWTGKQILKL